MKRTVATFEVLSDRLIIFDERDIAAAVQELKKNSTISCLCFRPSCSFLPVDSARVGDTLQKLPQITMLEFHSDNFEALCQYMGYITSLKLNNVAAPVTFFGTLFKGAPLLTSLSIVGFSEVETFHNLSNSLPMASKLTRLVLRDIISELDACSGVLKSLKNNTSVTCLKFILKQKDSGTGLLDLLSKNTTISNFSTNFLLKPRHFNGILESQKITSLTLLYPCEHLSDFFSRDKILQKLHFISNLPFSTDYLVYHPTLTNLNVTCTDSFFLSALNILEGNSKIKNFGIATMYGISHICSDKKKVLVKKKTQLQSLSLGSFNFCSKCVDCVCEFILENQTLQKFNASNFQMSPKVEESLFFSLKTSTSLTSLNLGLTTTYSELSSQLLINKLLNLVHEWPSSHVFFEEKSRKIVEEIVCCSPDVPTEILRIVLYFVYLVEKENDAKKKQPILRKKTYKKWPNS
jgi:hypothetical protein